MAKDPAVLIYYKDIQMSTRHWDADARGWYFSLLMEQADKPEGLPNEIESLSVLAGVKPSQYERFKSCWTSQVCHLFEENPAGLLVNRKMEEVIDERKEYKSKQFIRGVVASLMKKLRATEKKFSEDQFKELSRLVMSKTPLDASKDQIEAVFNRTVEAYGNTIKGDAIGDVELNTEVLGGTGGKGEKTTVLRDDLELPVFTLEAAEMNQYTHTHSKNTDFIKSQWRIFLTERMNDPPQKRAQYLILQDLTSYFLNWIRHKHPKNGSHQQVNGKSSGTEPKLGTSAARIAKARNW